MGSARCVSGAMLYCQMGHVRLPIASKLGMIIDVASASRDIVAK